MRNAKTSLGVREEVGSSLYLGWKVAGLVRDRWAPTLFSIVCPLEGLPTEGRPLEKDWQVLLPSQHPAADPWICTKPTRRCGMSKFGVPRRRKAVRFMLDRPWRSC